ncbi:FXSXX-COOH protein [Streptomyces sp. NPDC019443]|uniref:FXSXX-COOH protein n=1 Tax=Streptomyces sp. NPDC019443 TaxID=3365061 RepID=UPI0037A68712
MASDEQPPAIVFGAIEDHSGTPLGQVPEAAQNAVLARVGSAHGETVSAFQSSGSAQTSP